MPARVIEKLTTLPAIPNKFGEDGGKFYSYYDELADELDDNMVASLKAQLDGILIFAGLFAGVNSAFLAFTLPKMSADAADDTNALLFQIILGSNRTITSPKDLPSASFSPPPGTLSINILFSLSLTLALVSSFLAVLGQQWLVYYRKRSGGGPEFQRWEQLRRYLGAKRWRLELVLDDILPSMLQIALVIFCVAFVLYLGTLSSALCYVIMVPLCVVGAIVLAMAICSGWDRWCPFRTPLSNILQPTLHSIIRLAKLTLPSSLSWIFTAFTWLIYVSKRGTTQFDFKNESKSRAIALTDWIHGLHAKSAKSAQYTNELELIAITRVLNTSEDPAALVYAAMNLQCVREPELLSRLVRQADDFRDRFQGLHYFSIEPATDPDSTRTFALASSWYHVILSTGSVEDLLGNDERLLLETHINEPDYTVKLVIQLSQRYSFGPQPSDMFNSNPLTYSMFVIEQIISQDGLRYVFVDGRTTEPPNPTRGNAISYGTAWTEALMIKIVQEWNEQGGFPNPLHRATWQVAKLRDLFYTYRNMNDARFLQILSGAIATSDSRLQWSCKPSPEAYFRLFDRFQSILLKSSDFPDDDLIGAIFLTFVSLLHLVDTHRWDNVVSEKQYRRTVITSFLHFLALPSTWSYELCHDYLWWPRSPKISTRLKDCTQRIKEIIQSDPLDSDSQLLMEFGRNLYGRLPSPLEVREHVNTLSEVDIQEYEQMHSSLKQFMGDGTAFTPELTSEPHGNDVEPGPRQQVLLSESNSLEVSAPWWGN